MTGEYERRTRHLLARIQAIVARMDNGDPDVSDFTAHLQGRLSALGRAEAAGAYASHADLELILRDELLACAAQDAQVRIAGPGVKLDGRAAEVLTLAFHELATNSVKFGALSQSSGRIAIRWRVKREGDQPQVHLTWTESGAPAVVAAPRHEGFGHELLTRRIPYELGGTGSFILKPGGLVCVISFPLDGAGS